MTTLLSNKSSVSFSLMVYLIIALLGATIFSREHANAQGTLQVKFSYEAKNYAPMEYLTRAGTPITPASRLRVSVILWTEGTGGNISFKPSQDYVYRWYLNNNYVGGGKGVNAIDLTVPPAAIAPQDIRLSIEDLRGRKIAAAAQKIPLAAPTVGIFERIGESYSHVSKTAFAVLPGNQISLAARTFFFSTAQDALSYKWTHEGRLVNNPLSDPSSFAIGIATSSPSSAQDRFGIEIVNIQKPAEMVSRAFTIYTQ